MPRPIAPTHTLQWLSNVFTPLGVSAQYLHQNCWLSADLVKNAYDAAGCRLSSRVDMKTRLQVLSQQKQPGGSL